MSHRFLNGISLRGEHLQRELELSNGNMKIECEPNTELDIIDLNEENEIAVLFAGDLEYIIKYNDGGVYIGNDGNVTDDITDMVKIETDFDSTVNRFNKRMGLIGDSSSQCTNGVGIINYTLGRQIRFLKSLNLKCDTIFRYNTFVKDDRNISVDDCSFVSLRNVSALVKGVYLSTNQKEINLRYIFGLPDIGECLLVDDNIKAEECRYIRMHAPNFKRIDHSILELDKNKYLDFSNVEYIQGLYLYVVGDNTNETYILDFKDKNVMIIDRNMGFMGVSVMLYSEQVIRIHIKSWRKLGQKI